MSRAIKIAPDGTIEEVDVLLNYPDFNKNFGDDALIERVQLRRMPPNPDGSQNILIIDEEGRLKALPYNELATRLYVNLMESDFSFIVGDAFLITEQPHADDWEALSADVTVDTLKATLEALKGR